MVNNNQFLNNKGEHPQIRKHKVLFLNINGVLQPGGSQKRFAYDLDALKKYFVGIDKRYESIDKYDLGAVYFDWDLTSVALLKALLEETGTNIIISGEWNRSKNLSQIKLLFAIHGLDKYIEDYNPITEEERDTYDKKEAINKYLATHKVDYYAVVDDDSLFCYGEKMRNVKIPIKYPDFEYLKEALSFKSIKENQNTITIRNEETEITLEYTVDESDGALNIRIVNCNNHFYHRHIDSNDRATMLLIRAQRLLEYSLNYLINKIESPLYFIDFGIYNSIFFEDININARRKLEFDSNNCLCYESESLQNKMHM